MAWATLASVDDVRNAGNLGDRIAEGTIRFYLQTASYFMVGLVGTDNYGEALSDTLDAPDNDRLRKAEACMAVSFAMPAIGVHLSEMGMIKQMAMARGGEYMGQSFAREISELAASFMNMAQFLITSDYVTEERYNLVWHHIVQNMFPALDEHPTRAPIKSYAEGVIQDARGTDDYLASEL